MAAKAWNTMADTQVQSVWLQLPRNPMAASMVQSLRLLMARNSIADTLVQLVVLQKTGTPLWTPWCS